MCDGIEFLNKAFVIIVLLRSSVLIKNYIIAFCVYTLLLPSTAGIF